MTFIPGDGIGPEVAEAARQTLEATGVRFDWDVQTAGLGAIEEHGTPLPGKVVESLRANRVGIKGPLSTPVGGGFRSANIALRNELGLYANIRPCKTYQGAPSRYENVDLVFIRATTEDLYAGIEFARDSAEANAATSAIKGWLPEKSIPADAGITVKFISETASRRLFQFAFEYVRKNGRRKVMAVHKASVMKATDGLFLAVARDVAAENPDIEFSDGLVDNICGQLVRQPDTLDVLVSPMQYGDLLSDIGAALVGGLGIAPGVNVGPEGALFESAHGSAPKYAETNRANPMAMILSGAMMLHHLGERDAGDRLESAIAAVLCEGTSVTFDMKADRSDSTAVGTSQVADAVIQRLSA